MQITNIQRRKPSLAELGGISWDVLEGVGKVGQDLDGQGGEVKIVQTGSSKKEQSHKSKCYIARKER